MNRKLFFDSVRDRLFGGQLSQAQVEGIDAILDAWEQEWQQRGNQPYTPLHQSAGLAYVLATTQLETDRTMQSIKEYGGPAYFKRMYDIEGDRPHKARELGNHKPGDGELFAGRGPVMVTGRDNYQRMGDKLGIDLASNPDLVLQSDIGAKVLVSGMIDGDFTSRKLSDYISHEGFDFVGARWIVNGQDRAVEIAQFASHYMAALEEAKKQKAAQQIVETVKQPSPVAAPVTAAQYTPPAPSLDDPPPDNVWRDPETGEIVKSWNADAETPGASEYLPEAVNTSSENEPFTNFEIITEKPKVLDRLSGWKTHIGMVISGVIGIAAMFGYIPNMNAATGAQMLQAAFGVSGFRSGIPKIIQMAIIFYLKNKAATR